MRFEIKAGGAFVMLAATALLSSTVFVLGLFAGYDVGRQVQIESTPLAIGYALRALPPNYAWRADAEASPPRVRAPAIGISTSGPRPRGSGETAMPLATSAEKIGSAGSPMNRTGVASRVGASPGRQRVTTAESSIAAALAGPTDDNKRLKVEPVGGQGDQNAGRKQRLPYSIQIQAAMGKRAADEMMSRLRRLGYSTHLASSEIAGQQRYKVEVGPYATQQEAAAAEVQLRQKYDETYGRISNVRTANTPAHDSTAER